MTCFIVFLNLKMIPHAYPFLILLMYWTLVRHSGRRPFAVAVEKSEYSTGHGRIFENHD